MMASCGGPSAILVTVSTPPGLGLRVPDDIDYLGVDVKDGAEVVAHGDFTLVSPMALPQTVSVVEGPTHRTTLLVEVEARTGGKSGNHVAAGSANATFVQHGTAGVTVLLTR